MRLRLLVPVVLLLVVAALACRGGEEASPTPTPRATQVLETLTPSPTVAVARTATPTSTASVTATPRPTPTPMPSPEPVVEGTEMPSGCLASSPNPSEAPVGLGEPTRYARGLYSIGLDGSGPALLVDRAGAVVGTAAWNPLYQTYSATPDGSAVAFVAGQQAHPGQAELYLLTPVGSSEPRLVATFDEIWNLAIAPEGDLVAVRGTSEGGETSLYLVDTRDGAVTPIQLSFRWPGEPIWSPTGEWLALAGGTTEEEPPGIYTLRPDGSGLKRLADGGPPMAWSPGGSRIAFAIDRWQEGAGLYTTDLEGDVAKVSDTVAPQYDIPSLAWSPDGRCIVFAAWSEQGELPPIRVLDVETGWEMFLTNGAHPTWSPDGQRIAFVKNESAGGGDVYVINVDGSGERKLMDISWQANKLPLAWSPDGSRLTVTAQGLFVIDLGSGQSRKVSGNAYDPAWSPDGAQLAFTFWEGDGPSESPAVYVVNADGSGQPRKLTDGSGPSWSPDGNRIAFVR